MINNFEKTATECLSWINNATNKTLLSESQKRIEKLTRRSIWKTQKLKETVHFNPSISVYGPSQAGKSFLVSVLARPANGSLICDFGNDIKLNYIEDINPAGDGESTGIVTRFTSKSYSSPNSSFPIKLRLLSEVDLICIFINSFFLDIDQKTFSSETLDDLKKFIFNFSDSMPDKNTDLKEEELWEIEDYLRSNFSAISYANNLLELCDDIFKTAVKLNVDDRIKLYSVFWGQLDAFTDLFSKLAVQLSDLNQAKEIFVPLAALTPKNHSIIDVQQLSFVTQNNTEDLEVMVSEEKRFFVSRALLSALAAELVVPFEKVPHKFLNHTDLLDFPGARNRFERDANSDLDENIHDCLLRGKIAFLFDKYVAAQEINSMLLCIPNSTMELTDLPALIETWIADSVGSDKIARQNAENPLFFVLTKFDLHLSDTAAQTGEKDRFARRLRASFEKFAPTSESWPLSWDTSGPFKNCYWLRNPNVDQTFFERTDNSEKKLESPDKLLRLDELKEMYFSTEEVQRYFKDPLRAWEAAITPNDGGVSYLVENIEKVCDENLRSNQIKLNIKTFSQELVTELSPFHISDDFGTRKKAQFEKLAELRTYIEFLLEKNIFGDFLDAINLSQNYFMGNLSRSDSLKKDKTINKIIEIWKLYLDKESAVSREVFKLQKQIKKLLVDEVNKIFIRKNVASQLMKKLHFIGDSNLNSSEKDLVAFMCCNELNEILGFLSPSQNGLELKLEKLEEREPDCSKQLADEWLTSFESEMVKNLEVLDEANFDRVSNETLGVILTELKGTI